MLVLCLLVVGLVAPTPLVAGAQVSASGGGGCQVVHIGPSIAAGAPASSYFNLSVEPGTTIVEKMVVANPNPYSCGVTLSAAYGTTAVNGGDSYAIVAAGRPCVGPACWLAGLPQTIMVPGDDRVLAPFTIAVPSTATSGQYLAGVIGQSTTPPAAPHVGNTGGQVGSVGASVVTRVAIGVAITLPGALAPRLVISAVTLAPAGLAASTIDVTVRNTGNTWVHPRGTVTVALPSSTRAAPVASGTVLPGDRATLSAPERSVPGGLHRVDVMLNYAEGVAPATWQGNLSFPQPPAVSVSGGTLTIVAPSGSPAWEMILLIGLPVAVLAFGLLLLFFWGRRRRPDDAEGGFDRRPLGPATSFHLRPSVTGRTRPRHARVDVRSPVVGNGGAVSAPLVSVPSSGQTGFTGSTDGR
jgi:hypothetical protein